MTASFRPADISRATVIQRRRIGAYYTPRRLADILCEWAIRRSTDYVLEPSFGGCEFLIAAKEKLEALRAANPWDQIFGADVDPFAFSVLDTIGARDSSHHFKQADFLSLRPRDFAERRVEALVCNPPYVRHHAVDDVQQGLTRAVRDSILPTLSLQANLWAFFVLHGCAFLSEGGRAAWVLPQSFHHATYARDIRAYLQTHFKRLLAITVQERLFKSEGADEGTVLILADGWSQDALTASVFEKHSVSTLSEIDPLLARLEAGSERETVSLKDDEIWARMKSLGELCDFRIGIVTGDTRFFLFDKKKAQDYGIDKSSLAPIVTRARLIPGITVSRAEIEESYYLGERSRILDTSSGKQENVKAYIDTLSSEYIERNATFSKRRVWHQPLNGTSPDAFFTGMSHRSPRLVLNTGNLDCTNTLYRVTFMNGVSEETRKLIALSLVSTVGQLSSEMVGRRYGAGLLKHEPSDARRIMTFFQSGPGGQAMLEKAFFEANQALKEGLWEKSTACADHFLLENGYISVEKLSAFRAELGDLQKSRLT